MQNTISLINTNLVFIVEVNTFRFIKHNVPNKQHMLTIEFSVECSIAPPNTYRSLGVAPAGVIWEGYRVVIGIKGICINVRHIWREQVNMDVARPCRRETTVV